MNHPSALTHPELASDAELVAATLAGHRRAFGQIVKRYQRLLCSLAYSATGQLTESEDIAQEAFVEAWRRLHTLREPDKLRPWLCGILRFKVSRARRTDRREPSAIAEGEDALEFVATSDALAPDAAMEKEEQVLLWKALERLPDAYREPLILFYREHQSVEHVAASLDLSEDAVKQRLVRGRKILQEQVLQFVQGALARSTPGKVFTIGVLAALPELATPAKAIGVGAAAMQGASLAKSTSVAVWLSSLSGLYGAVMTLRANLDQARTPRERRAVVKITLGITGTALLFLALLYLLRECAFRAWDDRVLFAVAAQVLVVANLLLWPFAVVRTMRHMRALRTAERLAQPHLFHPDIDRVGSAAGEYRSRWSCLGVPLVHVRFASPDAGAKPVFAWVAGGDRAYGLLFAWGALAVAPVSIGAFSVGLLAIGSVSFGLVSLGTLVVGGLAVGAASVGIKAYAWLSALGWETAQCAGFGIARVAAEAPVALAQFANDATARTLLQDPNAHRNHMIFIATISLAAVVPLTCYAVAVRRRLGAAPRRG